MPNIESVTTGFYRVPLPEILTDSMHGIMRDFELVTAVIRDADGAEGMGYTFTVGRNGGAIANIISSEMTGIIVGLDADSDRSHLEPAVVGDALWRPGRPDRSGPLRR